jgi:hypothetical protein
MNFWPFKKKPVEPKPHIVKHSGEWRCGVGMQHYRGWLVCEHPMGSGSTPWLAFSHWKRQC